MKKRTLWSAAAAVMTAAMMLTACGAENGTGNTETAEKEAVETRIEETSQTETEETAETLEETNQGPVVSLPAGIEAMRAEEEPNAELRDLIIKELEIPEEDLEETKYYYNYVDLNEDGEGEIFVMVAGPYTSGTGGSEALWVTESEDGLSVSGSFTLVNEPVIISTEVENGHHVLIIPYYGGDGERYSVLKYQDGGYPNLPDGEMLDSLDGITGTAILANDRGAEADAGIEWMNLKDE